MSKEMAVIILGLLNIVIATGLLAVPGTWRMVLFVVIGIALMILGFLLRSETLSRGSKLSRNSSFVENLPAEDAASVAHDYSGHKDNLTSLN